MLWVINLGCIDLNQWYAKCDDVDRLTTCISISTRPGRRLGHVLQCGRIVRDALEALEMSPLVKTPDREAPSTSDRGGGPAEDVWTLSKALAVELAALIRS